MVKKRRFPQLATVTVNTIMVNVYIIRSDPNLLCRVLIHTYTKGNNKIGKYYPIE